MHSEMYAVYSGETHEQFIQRANRVFPVDCAKTWSRIERAVFNQLLGKMIHQFGYGAITDTMLYQSRDDMARIVQRCTGSHH